MARRAANICENCKYIWYPKGHDLSKTCPNCGSSKVRLHRNEFSLLIAVLGAIIFFASLSDLFLGFGKLKGWALQNSGFFDIMIASLGLLIGWGVRSLLVRRKE